MQSIDSLGKAGELAAIRQHSRWLQILNQQVRAWLPAALQAHVAVANYRGGLLVLHADAAAWATQLRFFTPKILQAWRETDLPALEHIKVKIATTRPEPEKAGGTLHLSEPAAAMIESAAASIAYDPLRQAMQRLAARRGDG
jgi:hypothetical protein